MNLVELETLFRLLNQYGITEFSHGDIKITLPSPTKSFADRIMTISNEELSAISERAVEIKIQEQVEKQKTQEELDDEALFFHEHF